MLSCRTVHFRFLCCTSHACCTNTTKSPDQHSTPHSQLSLCAALEICGKAIFSEDEPSRFPDQQVSSCMNCTWVLSVVASKRVKLTFSQFVLGSGDKVQIYNGDSKKSPLIVRWREGDSPTDVVSSGSSMTVILITDRCGQNPLIKASFKAIGNCNNAGNNRAVINKIFLILDCGNLFYINPGNGKSVQIQSPNFPKKYPNNLCCIWMFVSSGDLLLSVRVNIEVVGTAESGDKLIIQKSLEASRSDRQVHKYYGKTKRNKSLTFRNTPGLTIKFYSNEKKRGKGFSLNVVALAQGKSIKLLIRLS